jgi:WD40 repeat protein
MKRAVAVCTTVVAVWSASRAITEDAPVGGPAGAAKGRDIDGDPLPAGAIARLGTKRFRAGREAMGLAFADGGKALVQLTRDGWLQTFDPNSGRLLRERRVSKHDFGYESAAFGGGLVAASGWYTESVDEERQRAVNFVAAFDQATGGQKFETTTESGNRDRLALSPDGRTLAYGDRTLHLVDTSNGAELLNKDMAGGRIESLAFSPDGFLLAIGGPDRVLIWPWAAGGQPLAITIARRDPRSSPRWVDGLAFCPDGTMIAAGTPDSESRGVLLFDVASGKLMRNFAVPAVRYLKFSTLTFSPDGKLLAVQIDDLNSGGGVALWDVASGRLVHRLRGLFGDASCLKFSPDSRQLAASSSWYSTMCVWNVATGEPLSAGLSGHVRPPNTFRFLPGDKRLATSGDDETVRIWNLADSRQERVMQHVRNEHAWDCMIRGMDVSPDGKYVASSSCDDTVRVWDADTGREVYRLPGHGHYGGNRAVRFTPDGKQFASWGDDMRVYVWDVATGKAAQELRLQPAGMHLDFDLLSRGEPGAGLWGGCFSADASTLIVLFSDARRFSVRSGEELPKIDLKIGPGAGIAVSGDNRYLLETTWGVISYSNGQRLASKHPIELRSLTDGKSVAKVDVDGGNSGPVVFSPDGQLVAVSVIADHTRIELRKTPELSELARIDLPSRANAVEFSHSGKLLAASVADSTVLVWNLDDLAPTENQK